jgi:predicted flavoprotein YhiN
MIKCEIAIIGTGPAALMAGSILQSKGISVAFFDHNKAAGRKFLVAGKGGFNLTNNADIERFVDKYNHPILQQAVRLFTKDHFIDFLKTLGIETYVGSSGKIFPVKGTKPIEVLDRWISQLKNNGANFYFSHRLIDFQNETLTFQFKDQLIQVASKKKIFALGGGSWKVTGSDGKWLTLFQSKGFATTEFKSKPTIS